MNDFATRLRRLWQWIRFIPWRLGFPRFKKPLQCHTCGTWSKCERDHLTHEPCVEPTKALEYRETIDRLRKKLGRYPDDEDLFIWDEGSCSYIEFGTTFE